MEMLTFPILIVSFLLTLWLTSHIAKQLQARHWKMPIIFACWLVGLIFSMAALILLDVLTLEPMLKLGLQIGLPLVLTTLAYVLFARLSVVSAFTTNVAGVFIGLILSVVVVVALGLSVDRTFASANMFFVGTKAQITSMITGKEVVLPVANVEEVFEEEMDEQYSTNDFLTPEAQAALEKQKNKVYTNPHYRDMSIFNARRAIGMRVRVSWKDGKSASGKLDAVQGGDLIVTLRRKEGAAQVPIAMSSLKKLEVYR
ncbi:MAG: hypothetical protein ACPG47_02545 [Leucothrix sp.]